MFTVRQIDLSYESIWNIRSKIHKSNVTFCCRLTECSQLALVLLEGEGNTVQLFTESCKWLIQNLKVENNMYYLPKKMILSKGNMLGS